MSGLYANFIRVCFPASGVQTVKGFGSLGPKKGLTEEDYHHELESVLKVKNKNMTVLTKTPLVCKILDGVNLGAHLK